MSSIHLSSSSSSLAAVGELVAANPSKNDATAAAHSDEEDDDDWEKIDVIDANSTTKAQPPPHFTRVLDIMEIVLSFADDRTLVASRSVCTLWNKVMNWNLIIAERKAEYQHPVRRRANTVARFVDNVFFGPNGGGSSQAGAPPPAAVAVAAKASENNDDDGDNEEGMGMRRRTAASAHCGFDVVPDTWIVDADDRERTVLVMESERYYPFLGWSKKLLLGDPCPFQTIAGGKRVSSYEDAEPDPGFRWAEDSSWSFESTPTEPPLPTAVKTADSTSSSSSLPRSQSTSAGSLHQTSSSRVQKTCIMKNENDEGWEYQMTFGAYGVSQSESNWKKIPEDTDLVRRRFWRRRSVRI